MQVVAILLACSACLCRAHRAQNDLPAGHPISHKALAAVSQRQLKRQAEVADPVRALRLLLKVFNSPAVAWQDGSHCSKRGNSVLHAVDLQRKAPSNVCRSSRSLPRDEYLAAACADFLCTHPRRAGDVSMQHQKHLWIRVDSIARSLDFFLLLHFVPTAMKTWTHTRSVMMNAPWTPMTLVLTEIDNLGGPLPQSANVIPNGDDSYLKPVCIDVTPFGETLPEALSWLQHTASMNSGESIRVVVEPKRTGLISEAVALAPDGRLIHLIHLAENLQKPVMQVLKQGPSIFNPDLIDMRIPNGIPNFRESFT
mmetsp:Transcript_129496/g.242222  ORF Transcript_129496/g.242222 Transcript_129496/m.242222 type:complete len:311 (+) Transcript_129496:55-987(+)